MTALKFAVALVVAISYSVPVVPASGQEKRMTIEGFAPELPIAIAGTAWFIFLDGAIDSAAASRLEQYIKRHRIPERSFVYLNSPGGSLIAGIELGRLIRKYGLSTDVGKRAVGAIRRFDVEAGRCYSAWAYAYLGGQFRYLKQGSRYGVHQFSTASPKGGDEGTAQIAAAIIVEYMRSMDVDTELFSLSVSAAPKGINEIDTQTLERLNAVNGGRTRPVWTIESTEGQLYFKGERMTAESGINKFMLFCSEGRKVMLYAIFDALRRDDELMLFPAHSLLVDDQEFRINVESKSIRNGWYNGIYGLSLREIQALRNANQVGVSLRFAYDAPVFFGFQGMPLADGRQKLLGLLNQCN